MAGYTRQSLSEIQDGQVVDAAPINAEYNTIQGAFSAVSGHKHDGTSAEGAPITVVGPTQNVNISATEMYPRVNNYVNIGTDALKFKDLKLAGNANVAGTATVQTLSVGGNATVTGNITVTGAVQSGLDVVGNVGVTGNIVATGNATAVDVIATDDVIAGGDAFITGNAFVTGGVAASELYSSGSLGADGIVTALGKVSAPYYEATASTGYTFLNSNGVRAPSAGLLELYNVSGKSVLLGSTSITVTGNTSFADNVTVGGTLGVTGNTTLSGTLGVSGAITGASVNVSGAVTSATSSTTGNATVGGNSTVTGNATVSGKVLASNGTAAAPSIAFTGDTNTGIASFGADSMGLIAGGAAKLTVDTVDGLTANQGLYFPAGAKIEAFDGTINSTVSAGGSANAITVTVPVKNATQFYLRPLTANTGATTISINGAAAIPVQTPDGGALPAGYTLPTGGTYPPLLIIHMGTHVIAFRTYVERGSNANGDYIRWADGTQICYGAVTTSTTAEASVTFAAAFSANPRVTLGVNSAATFAISPRFTSLSTSGLSMSAYNTSNARIAAQVEYHATGRWF